MQAYVIGRQEFYGECGGVIAKLDEDGGLIIRGHDFGSGIVWVVTTDNKFISFGRWSGDGHCEYGVIDCSIPKIVQTVPLNLTLQQMYENKMLIVHGCSGNRLLSAILSKPKIRVMPPVEIINGYAHITWGGETQVFKIPYEHIDELKVEPHVKLIDNCIVFGDGMHDYLAVKLITSHAKRYHPYITYPIAKRLRSSDKKRATAPSE